MSKLPLKRILLVLYFCIIIRIVAVANINLFHAIMSFLGGFAIGEFVIWLME